MKDDADRQFLFLSDTGSEAATSRLAVAEIPYVRKRLESKADNWLRICEIIDGGDVAAVLVKLTTHTMRAMISEDYEQAADGLLRRIAELPNVVFVHMSFFEDATEHSTSADQVDEEEDEWFGAAAHFGSLERGEMEKVTKLLERHGVELTPYRRNVELSVLAGQFVEDRRRNLVFRIYVPTSRLFAEQVGEMLNLFRDYLMNAVGLAVQMTTNAARNGTTYEFLTGATETAASIGDRLAPFSEAMGLCVRDPEGAERLLVQQGADADEVSRLVATYAKRMRRLASDARQEREHKVLLLRHRMENELEDLVEDASPETIAALVDRTVPRVDRPERLLATLAAEPSPSTATPSVVLNYRPQIIAAVNGIVAQEVRGTQNFGPEASRILTLIERMGGDRSKSLAADLHELEGGDASDAARLSAAGRIRSFLASAASKAADKAIEAAIGSAQTYLTHKFGI